MAAAAHHYDVILAPVITEKATLLDEGKNAFYVRVDASKKEIKDAVEAIWAHENKKVKAVNTIKLHGKTKRFRGRLGQRSNIKKAYVSLAAGQQIDTGIGA